MERPDPLRVWVTGIGLVSPAGLGAPAHREAILGGGRFLSPLSLFAVSKDPLPVGQVSVDLPDGDIPRTHRLALVAAREAMALGAPPDAIVLGCTTGGMPRTESLLKESVRSPADYALHGTGTVANHLARELGCRGPALTVSTACSSGAAALKIAREMLLAGDANRVLAGGADALCRLTYHGFRMLQLIDPEGSRPLDRDREGMSVGEAAAFLLLTASPTPPEGTLAELMGGGLSCDAHHPSAPSPDGTGALDAMRQALDDAGVSPGNVGYLNLHGTGTKDNDASEAKAIRSLFSGSPPPLSSVKGIFGHSLAAAGALEAALAVLCLEERVLPGNVGCSNPDPDLVLEPLPGPRRIDPGIILSNSFGFGGNNAALLLGRPGPAAGALTHATPVRRLRILGAACLTGAGHTVESMEKLVRGQSVAGILEEDQVTRDLPPRSLRRLKRLARLTLALGSAALLDADEDLEPHGVFVGTGWGPLSETNDFLQRLYGTGEEFSSPTDFVGSVHNAAASQLAIRFGARGPNITATNGDTSFEDAAYLASLLAGDRPFLLCGVDERHEILSPLLDPSSDPPVAAADGGGGLLARAARPGEPGPFLVPHPPLVARDDPADMVASLGGAAGIQDRFAAILVGLPAADDGRSHRHLERFLECAGFDGPVVSFRPLLGEYATASAAATVLAVHLVRNGVIPEPLAGGAAPVADPAGVLILGVDETWSAMEVLR